MISVICQEVSSLWPSDVNTLHAATVVGHYLSGCCR